MSQHTIRPAQPRDLPAICQLFERSFGRPVDEAWWRWKFVAHDVETLPTVWVTTAGDRLIGHYGGFPRQLALSTGQTLLTMTTGDTMTDPDFRRQGVLGDLVSTAHADWRDRGLGCVFGLPNQQWGSRIQTLDWRLLYPLQWRLRPLRPEKLLARKLSLPVLGNLTALGSAWNRLADRTLRTRDAVTVKEVSAADATFDRLDPRDHPAESRPESSPAETCSLARGAAWVQWRYFDSHPLRYRVLVAHGAGGDAMLRDGGYLVWRIDHSGQQPFGLIAEMQARSDAAQRTLLRHALAAMADAGAVAAAALAVPGTQQDRLLRRAGFAFSWGSFDVRCVPLRDDLPLDRLGDEARFKVAGGDFDVV